MFSFDLKAGYHHIDIDEKHWQYLGFPWNNGGEPKCYVFVYFPLVWPPLVTCLLNYLGRSPSIGVAEAYRQ